jgi:ATP-dependent DNA ligase
VRWRLPQESFVLDGEVVVLLPDGVSDFDVLASRKHDKRATLYAFDMLVGDGEDLRSWPPLRKGALAGFLSDPVDAYSSPSTNSARSAKCCSRSPA